MIHVLRRLWRRKYVEYNSIEWSVTKLITIGCVRTIILTLAILCGIIPIKTTFDLHTQLLLAAASSIPASFLWYFSGVMVWRRIKAIRSFVFVLLLAILNIWIFIAFPILYVSGVESDWIWLAANVAVLRSAFRLTYYIENQQESG